MHNPQSLLEAYYSIYEQPEIVEEYLDEDDQYFYEVAEFLLDEGFTEDEIYELTEEEDFLDILEVIEEAKKRTKTQIRQMGLSGRRTRQMGAEPRQMRGGEPVGASGKRLTGATKKSAESDIEAVRKARAERRQGSDRLASKQPGSYHVRQRLKNMEKEMDNKPEQKPASKPSQSLVGRLKSAAAAGMERHRQATQTAGKVAKGVGAYLATKHAATAKRASAQSPANKAAIERLARKKAHKAASEEFEYVLNYVMEEGYDYEEALDIIEELDDETIEEIMEEYDDLMEVTGYGKVDPHTGGSSDETSRAQRARYKGGSYAGRSRPVSSGSVTAAGKTVKHTATSTVSGQGRGSKEKASMSKAPLEKAKAKYDALRARGENKRANKIGKFLERGGNRYD